MKCIIIDDEHLARERLVLLLSEINPEIQIVGKAANGFEGLELIKTHSPDFILLDIQMPEMTGFEMLEQCERKPFVIFVTAFNEFALEAFQAHALRYLLKPIKKEELAEALIFIENHFAKPESSPASNKLQIREGNRNIFIPKEEIRALYTISRIVFIHTEKDKYIADKGMDYYEKELEEKHYFRGHRSFLFNTKFIKDIKIEASGKRTIHMDNGLPVTVSRENAKAFKELMKS